MRARDLPAASGRPERQLATRPLPLAVSPWSITA